MPNYRRNTVERVKLKGPPSLVVTDGQGWLSQYLYRQGLPGVHNACQPSSTAERTKTNGGQPVHRSRRTFRSEWETRTCHWRHQGHWNDDSARPAAGGRPRHYQLTQARHVRGGTTATV